MLSHANLVGNIFQIMLSRKILQIIEGKQLSTLIILFPAISIDFFVHPEGSSISTHFFVLPEDVKKSFSMFLS